MRAATFRKDRPRYLPMVESTKRQLRMFADEPDEDSLSCFCGD